MSSLRTLIAGAAALVVFAVPQLASASQVSVRSDGTVRYQAAPGEENSVRVTWNAFQGFVFRDSGDEQPVAITAGTGCVDLRGSDDVACKVPFPVTAPVEVVLHDRDDHFTTGVSYPIFVHAGPGRDMYESGTLPAASKVDFNGGSGVDVARWGNAKVGVNVHKDNSAFDGRPGDRDNIRPDVEELVGSIHADVLAGSSAADTFFGQEGDDLVSGNGGDDTFLSAPVRDGADFYNGGAGVDTMKYSERSGEPLTVTPDVGSQNDGRPGERDTVRTEIVIGSIGRDVLDASAAPGAGYVLDGLSGDDTLLGSAGADQLLGGSGLDRMEGRGGNDFLDSLDGRQETLECGAGTDDVAKVDQSVPVNKRDILAGCERLANRPPVSNTGSLTPRR